MHVKFSSQYKNCRKYYLTLFFFVTRGHFPIENRNASVDCLERQGKVAGHF